MRYRRILSGLILACLLLFGCASVAPSDSLLEVYFLDVGQGDATLLRTAEGDVLIDSGPESAQQLLCLRLRELGVNRLRLLILTHPDEDHIGGADGILREIPTEEVWVSTIDEENDSVRALEGALDLCGVAAEEVRFGEKLLLGGVTFFVFSPVTESAGGNEGSLILKVTAGDVSMLFSGDAEEKGEREVLNRCGATQLSCDLYKVGHHGSSTSTSKDFLAAMNPRYAIVSCGRENAYGHPHGAVLSALEAAGSEIFRTDLEGEIVFWTDGKRLERK